MINEFFLHKSTAQVQVVKGRYHSKDDHVTNNVAPRQKEPIRFSDGDSQQLLAVGIVAPDIHCCIEQQMKNSPRALSDSTLFPYHSECELDSNDDAGEQDILSLTQSSFGDLKSRNDSETDPEIEDLKVESEALASARLLFDKCYVKSARLRTFNPSHILGYGTFGVVVAGQLIPSKKEVAIKIMQKSTLGNGKMCVDPKNGLVSLMEIAILKYVPKHQNIIGYVTHWQDDKNWYLVTYRGGCDWRAINLMYPTMDIQTNQSWYPMTNTYNVQTLKNNSFPSSSQILLDPVASRPNDRSLAGLIRSCGGFSNKKSFAAKIGPVLPEHLQKHIFRQIANAVLVLHQNGITHRDLKDENVLIDQNFNAALIDFGHAGFFAGLDELNVSEGNYSSYGTSLFAAPELRSGIKIHGPEGDVYALGLMIYEANSGDVPDDVFEALYSRDGNCLFPMDSSCGFHNPVLVDLCKWMLCPDPKRRPLIQDVLSHPWLL